MGHRWFLPIKYLVRNRVKHFKGQADHRTKLLHSSGKEVFDKVKDIKVVFGNGPGNQPVPSKNGMSPHVEEEVYFSGATILGSLTCSQYN
jgi:hypothetical protein